MICNITSNFGFIQIGSVYVTWGCQTPGYLTEIPGYFCIGTEGKTLEFGVVDQEAPGIYFTEYEEGDIVRSRPVVQFTQSKRHFS